MTEYAIIIHQVLPASADVKKAISCRRENVLNNKKWRKR